MSGDIWKKLNASSGLMYKEALNRGYECVMFGDRETVLMQRDGKSFYVRGSRTSLQSSVGKTIADYKMLTKRVLQHFDIKTAKYQIVSRGKKLSEDDIQLKYPVVAKPVSSKHGKGVVVWIRTFEELSEVLSWAGGQMLVEEMLEGREYRVVCVDFKFVAAACREPAFVVGDGKSTVSELIEEKNAHRWRGKGHKKPLTVIEIDRELVGLVEEMGYELDSVVKEGEKLVLRRVANLSRGGEAHDVTDMVCKENRDLFEKIAKVSDLNTLGIDVMCESVEKPIIDQKKAGVIEVNASPGLRMHHYPMKGEVRDVAGKIFDMLEKKFE